MGIEIKLVDQKTLSLRRELVIIGVLITSFMLSAVCRASLMYQASNGIQIEISYSPNTFKDPGFQSQTLTTADDLTIAIRGQNLSQNARVSLRLENTPVTQPNAAVFLSEKTTYEFWELPWHKGQFLAEVSMAPIITLGDFFVRDLFQGINGFEPLKLFSKQTDQSTAFSQQISIAVNDEWLSFNSAKGPNHQITLRMDSEKP